MSVALLPAGIFFTAAFVCLLLEAAGTPAGSRKRAGRPHLVWIGALAAALAGLHVFSAWPDAAATTATTAGLVLDRVGLAACALIAALCGLLHATAAPSLRRLDEERGEVSAMSFVHAGALSVTVVATDLVVWTAAWVLAGITAAAQCAPGRDGPYGVEATTRAIVGTGLQLGLLGAAVVLTYAATGARSLDVLAAAAIEGRPAAVAAAGLLVVVGAGVIGAFPLQAHAVDVAHGSSSSSAFLTSGALVAGGVLLLRVVIALSARAPALAAALALAACGAMLGLPLSALAQARVARMVALLVIAQAGVVLAGLAALASLAAVGAQATLVAIVVGAVAGATALLGLMPARLDAPSTWEDWAGFGRRRPVLAALLIYALASVAGLPLTPGFHARLVVARTAFEAGLDAVGLVAVVSIALAAAPVVRFALFLFGKEPRAGAFEGQAEPLVAAAFGLLVALAAAIGFFPAPLLALAAAAVGATAP
jgi:NADH-quinone oxidoreductase subunit N